MMNIKMNFEELSQELQLEFGEVKEVSNGGGAIDAYTKDQTDAKFATKTEVANIELIAKGRATGYVFDTLDDMNAWLADESNVLNLVLGDNLYIRATDVPDYWWDGNAPQQLETQKVDLSDYASKEELNEKQDVLTSGTNIKTVNGESILGEGNIEIQGGGIKGIARNTTSSSGWVKFAPDENGIINIPCAAPGQAGLVITGTGLGSAKPHGYVSVTRASQNAITNRWEGNFVDTKGLDLAVKGAMCDGIGAAWTNAQKLAALLRLGCTVDEDGFVKWGT
jgi:hypothetical protein